MLKVLSSQENVTYLDLLEKMSDILKSDTEIPKLSSSRQVDICDPFEIIPESFSGARHAIIIGISYQGSRGELTGSHEAANNVSYIMEIKNKYLASAALLTNVEIMKMMSYIREAHGFEDENFSVLMDDGEHTEPTKANILTECSMVLSECQPGDAVFCYFVGKKMKNDENSIYVS